MTNAEKMLLDDAIYTAIEQEKSIFKRDIIIGVLSGICAISLSALFILLLM